MLNFPRVKRSKVKSLCSFSLALIPSKLESFWSTSTRSGWDASPLEVTPPPLSGLPPPLLPALICEPALWVSSYEGGMGVI